MKKVSQWTRLTQLIQAESEAYGQLLNLLIEEEKVLRRVHYQGVLDVTQQKENVLTCIRKIEKDRVACGEQLCEEAHVPSFFQWLVSETSQHAQPAKRAWQELIKIGRQVKQYSDRNSGLIDRGLHVVREAMHVVQESLGNHPLYGENGGLSFSSTSTSLHVRG